MIFYRFYLTFISFPSLKIPCFYYQDMYNIRSFVKRKEKVDMNKYFNRWSIRNQLSYSKSIWKNWLNEASNIGSNYRRIQILNLIPSLNAHTYVQVKRFTRRKAKGLKPGWPLLRFRRSIPRIRRRSWNRMNIGYTTHTCRETFLARLPRLDQRVSSHERATMIIKLARDTMRLMGQNLEA